MLARILPGVAVPESRAQLQAVRVSRLSKEVRQVVAIHEALPGHVARQESPQMRPL